MVEQDMSTPLISVIGPRLFWDPLKKTMISQFCCGQFHRRIVINLQAFSVFLLWHYSSKLGLDICFFIFHLIQSDTKDFHPHTPLIFFLAGFWSFVFQELFLVLCHYVFSNHGQPIAVCPVFCSFLMLAR